jgi:hypothetical protein
MELINKIKDFFIKIKLYKNKKLNLVEQLYLGSRPKLMSNLGIDTVSIDLPKNIVINNLSSLVFNNNILIGTTESMVVSTNGLLSINPTDIRHINVSINGKLVLNNTIYNSEAYILNHIEYLTTNNPIIENTN